MIEFRWTSEVTAWLLIPHLLLTATFQAVLSISKTAEESYKMLGMQQVVYQHELLLTIFLCKQFHENREDKTVPGVHLREIWKRESKMYIFLKNIINKEREEMS